MTSAMNVNTINQSREAFRSSALWQHDHLLFDACTLMWCKYTDRNGAVHRWDVDGFFEFIYSACPEIQRAKYGDKDSYILLLESVLMEIVAKATNRSGKEDEQTIKSGQLAIERYMKLQSLGLVKVIADGALGHFGDAGLTSAAMLANSRRSLLFVVQDADLARDIMQFRHMKSIKGMRHSVYMVDRYNFFKRVEEKLTDPYPTGTAEPSRPRGCGSISGFSFEGPLPEQPDFELDAVGDMDEGECLYCIDGKEVRLGREFGGGTEAQLFRIADTDDFCVKVFGRPTAWKQAKVELLSSRDFELDAAILPEEPCYTADHVFKGYIMRFAANTIPLSYLFVSASRKKYIAGWDRRDYVRLGLSLARAFYRLNVKGVLLTDVSCSNVRVQLNAEGVADPERVYIIDTDSAQLGPRGGRCYAADGISKAYAAPEVLREGWKKGELLGYKSVLFTETLLISRALMCGLHPYRGLDAANDPTFDEAAAIQAGMFPYGSRTVRRSQGVDSPGLGAYLWSYLPRGLKEKLHAALTSVDGRMPLTELIKELEKYIAWLNSDQTAETHPQARAIAPTMFKSFIARCSHGDHVFDAANVRGWVSKVRNDVEEYLCPQCAAEPVAWCESCHRVPTLTRGEQFLGRIPKRLCHDCFTGSRNVMAYFAQCKSCKRSFAVSRAEAASAPELCPLCRRADGAAPAGQSSDTPLSEHEKLCRTLEELHSILA